MATRRTVVACSLLGSLIWLAGCGDHDHHQTMAGGAGAQSSAMSYYIDTNATVPEASANPPGLGAALFLSYMSGGHWRMETRCDTLDPRSGGLACRWEVWAAAESSVANVTADSLTPGIDEAGSYPPSTVVLTTQTTTEIDAMSFDTTPGAAVYLTPYLDGFLANRELVVWMSGQTPSMPEAMGEFWLTPSAP